MASSLKIWVLEDLVREKLGQGQYIFDFLEDGLQKLTMPPDDMDRSGVVFDSKRMAFETVASRMRGNAEGHPSRIHEEKRPAGRKNQHTQ